MSNNINFTHLRTSSAYSLDRGTMTEDDIIELAKNNGQTSVALTDHCKMLMTLPFYIKARKNGLKPIIGVNIYIEPDLTKFPNSDLNQVLLIAKSNEGYKNLLKLVSKAHLENHFNDQPAIKQSWLKDYPELTKDLICLSGTFETSDIAQGVLEVLEEKNKELKKDKYNDLEKTILFYKEIFNNDFYLEIQRIGKTKEDDIILAYLGISNKLNIPLVATNPIEFKKREDFKLNEIRYCANQKTFLYDVYREEYSSPEQYFKSKEEMAEIFKGLEYALENTDKIAQKCNVKIDYGVPRLPSFDVPEGETEESYFRKLTLQGFENRMNMLFSNPEEREKQYPIYRARLNEEMDIIVKMGFTGYFLIVQDFINWSLNNGVSVGPGRGSGAGSLVAYSLNITNVDPIKYDLLFERFLNPERVSMPDFDIDFSGRNRDKVFEYVKNKYGEDKVSSITALNYDQIKASIKSCQRVVGGNLMATNEFTKALGNLTGFKGNIQELYDENEHVKRVVESSDNNKELFGLVKELGVLPKTMGRHAAGVVIYDGETTDYSAIYANKEKTNNILEASMYDKNVIEEAGGVKFDFLSLSNLDVIDNTVKAIEKNTGKKINVSFEQLDLDDPNIINVFKTGNTTGVFQFEGHGMRRAVMSLNPNNFEDIAAMTALYRPGPMQSGMMDSFINRKNGKEEIFYPTEEYNLDILKPALEKTYGVILYQEQVMQCAQIMAGYTFGQADNLRRAMGKKKPEEMAKQRGVFVEGAIKKGIDGEVAEKVFDIIDKFSGYGFNRSHSVAYTAISFQTAYLKAYYPEYLLAEMLNEAKMPIESVDIDNKSKKSSGGTDDKKILTIIEDCNKNNISFEKPSVNRSHFETIVDKEKNKHLILGLSMLKGVSNKNLKQIVEEREKNGEYKSFEDFIERNVNNSNLTLKLVEKLVKSEVLDEFTKQKVVVKNDEGEEREVYLNQAMMVENANAMFNLIKEENKTKTVKGKKSVIPLNELENILGDSIQDNEKKQEEAILNNFNWKEYVDYNELEKTLNEKTFYGINLEKDLMTGYVDYFNGLKAVSSVQEIHGIDFSKQKTNSVPMIVGGIIEKMYGTKTGKGYMVSIIGKPDERSSQEEDLSEFDDTEFTQDPEEEYNKQNFVDEEQENSFSQESELDKRRKSIFVNMELYKAHEKKLKEGNFIVFQGNVTKPRANSKFKDNGFFPEEIYSKSDLEQMLVREINILIDPKEPNKITPILREYPGKVPVTIYIPTKDKNSYLTSRLAKEFHVDGSADCIKALKKAQGEQGIKMEFRDRLVLIDNKLKNNEEESYAANSGNKFKRPPMIK